MSERRFFNRKERLALAVNAGFRCESCGLALDDFDADHEVPYSRGGTTDVTNGRALCASCNRSKGDRLIMRGIIGKLRRWQASAIDVVVKAIEAGKAHVLIAACPGAGKTLFAVTAWLTHKIRRDCDALVVVVYSTPMKSQWRRVFELAGIGAIDEVPNSDLEVRVRRGIDLFDPSRPIQIVTYAQVASNPELFRAQCVRHRVMVVFDEIHHAADVKTYGAALLRAFEHARFRMSLTGTPFNTDGDALAFCEFRDEVTPGGRTIRTTLADFEYSYGEALNATGEDDDPTVVRPVQFSKWNGRAEWNRVNLETGESEKRSTSGQDGEPFYPLLNMNGDYLRRMISAALDELNKIREHHPNAGMLITGMDVNHCRAIHDFLCAQGVTDSRVVTHEIDGAADAIRDFEHSRDRVLIAVRMVSEGVDIRRLRVGVYATNVQTRMFFTQFVGRFIRHDPSLEDGMEYGCIFIPEQDDLIQYALEIESMIASMTIPEPGHGPSIEQPKYLITGVESDGQHNGIIERGDVIERDHSELYERIISESGMAGRVSVGQMRKIESVMNSIRGGFQPQTPTSIAPVMPTEDDAKRWRRMNGKLVTRIVHAADKRGIKLDYSDINYQANRAVGIRNMDSLVGVEKLKQRAAWLEGLLRDQLLFSRDD